MARSVDRKTVWEYIREKHPTLAKELLCARQRRAETVSLERIGAKSRKFVWRSIQESNPGLADLLTKDEGFAAFREAFDGCHVELMTRDVIGAVSAAMSKEGALAES